METIKLTATVILDPKTNQITGWSDRKVVLGDKVIYKDPGAINPPLVSEPVSEVVPVSSSESVQPPESEPMASALPVSAPAAPAAEVVAASEPELTLPSPPVSEPVTSLKPAAARRNALLPSSPTEASSVSDETQPPVQVESQMPTITEEVTPESETNKAECPDMKVIGENMISFINNEKTKRHEVDNDPILSVLNDKYYEMIKRRITGLVFTIKGAIGNDNVKWSGNCTSACAEVLIDALKEEFNSTYYMLYTLYKSVISLESESDKKNI